MVPIMVRPKSTVHRDWRNKNPIVSVRSDSFCMKITGWRNVFQAVTNGVIRVEATWLHARLHFNLGEQFLHRPLVDSHPLSRRDRRTFDSLRGSSDRSVPLHRGCGPS